LGLVTVKIASFLLQHAVANNETSSSLVVMKLRKQFYIFAAIEKARMIIAW